MDKLKKKTRRPELDFLRGVALIIMVVGHPLRADVWVEGVHVALPRLIFNHYGELFSGLFMFISGINVTNFLASAKRNPQFDATTFYLKSSVWLFALGWTYNLCVGTALYIDLIQAIAIGTLVTYLLLSWRLPTWGLALFTAVVFALGVHIVGGDPVTPETIKRLGAMRYFVAFFGPIPWVGFFTFGVVVDRIKNEKWQKALIPLGGLVFALAHLLPPLRGVSPTVHLLKANARYIVQSIGLVPMLFLLSKRYYSGVSRIGREIEYWGRESLVFLVFHWFYIFLFSFPEATLQHRFGDEIAGWATGFFSLFIMALTVRPIAGLRDRWMRSPKFGARAWTVFIFAMIGWAWMLKKMMLIAKGQGVPVHDLNISTPTLTPEYFVFFSKTFFAFAAAMTFCFLYPYLRIHLRKNSMHSSINGS